MISEELKSKNLTFFQKKLDSIGVDASKFVETFGEKMMNASYALTNENGAAYDGSLLNIVLRKLTPYALKINELLPEESRVDSNSLMKVCMLSHISKCEMFVKNDNQWEIEKRGMIYKYGQYDLALKMGMRSLIMAQEAGITFTAQEIEGMIAMDKLADDKQSEFFSSPMSVIIRQANELTFTELRIANNKN